MSEIAKMNGSCHELDIRNGSVYAKTLLRRGTRYGPYPLKLIAEPIDRQHSWEVSVHNNNY